MNTLLIKNTLRAIKHSFGRFLSILAIVALGVAFLTGIKVSAPMMRETADAYMDTYNLMDFQILSTLGFDDQEVQSLQKVPGVLNIYPAYSLDTLTTESRSVIKLQSLPFNELAPDDPAFINQVKLVEGRLPKAPHEAVIDRNDLSPLKVSIGEKLSLLSGTETPLDEALENTSYTVVGIIQTPYYIHFERGSSAIGNGKVSNILYIPEENFKLPVYTELFLTAKDAKPLNTYSSDYENFINTLQPTLENSASHEAHLRYNTLLEDAKKKLTEGEITYLAEKDKVHTELAKLNTTLREGKETLSKAENELAYRTLDAQKGFNQGELGLEEAEKQLLLSQKAYDQSLSLFEEQKKEATPLIASHESSLLTLQKELTTLTEQIEMLLPQLELIQGEAEKAFIQSQLAKLQETYQATQSALLETETLLAEKKNELLQSEKLLAFSGAELTKAKEVLQGQKESLKTQKVATLSALEEARQVLNKQKLTLTQGESDYLVGKAKAEEELLKAETELQKAKEQLAALKPPQVYVLGRTANYGFANYKQATETIESVGKVFPLFFFLVAALVCLTTMTRMVDEERTTIGTFKALGYGTGAILSKYLLYAGIASLLGSLLGVLAGLRVFPHTIYNAYGMIFDLPPLIGTFKLSYVLTSIALMVLLTVSAAVVACSKELQLYPVYLMRPKAPQIGKKILLEKLPFIWNHLHFLQKIVARNIFRYKKKFFMTTIGISGCTALLLAGLGLKTSISTVVPKQYSELFNYDLEILVEEAMEDTLIERLGLSDTLKVTKSSAKLSAHETEREALLLVPHDLETYTSFFTLKDRPSQVPLPLDESGAILSEKLAKSLHLQIGDTFLIQDADHVTHEAIVSGITENYVGHTLYLSPAYYEQVYQTKPLVNQLLVKLPSLDPLAEDKLTHTLLNQEEVVTFSYLKEHEETFNSTIETLDTVIWVMVISAGLLAFIVLYNLTTINVSERMRELATIKVLGFYDLEVSRYIYRENMILTLVGTLLGLFLGTFLHQFILITAEMDNIMYDRKLYLGSYLFAALLTLIFAMIVNGVMHFKLKKIQMVESLKSID